MKATGDPLRAIALSVTLAAVAAMAGACGSSGGDGSRARGDAGDGAAQADAGVGGTAGAGGAGTAGSPSGGTGGVGLPPVICNGETCTVPDTSNGLQAYACCVSDTNACGVRVPLSATCFAHRLPGGIDPACGPYELPGKITLPGCCGPKGCGALGLFGDLGCLPNADLGLPAKACLYSEDGGGAPAGDAAAD